MSGVRIGSDEHKELFCRWFIETHRVYEPGDLPWPDLNAEALDRLRSVPIWDAAVQVETKAGELVTGFAESLKDQTIREAVALQGVEETRHGRMLKFMLDRYGVKSATKRLPVVVSERAFIDFGYKECLDAFIGFGAFRVARDANFLPDEFLDIFTAFMAEETRHIVFFVNWIAYERTRRGYGNPILQTAATAYGYGRALRLLTGSVNSANGEYGFMGGGDVFGNLTLRKVLEICLRENDAQMDMLDRRLIRPRVIPALARISLSFLALRERFTKSETSLSEARRAS